jgi:UDP-2,3-diacylglucosamine pyrophosphatase LpxH
MVKRKVEVLILSDIHLGTYGCRSKELLSYLKTIDPETIILNGDIIDIWQFNKRFFPKSHMKVIKYFTSYLSKGKEVYYITGNHDEMLRKFEGFQLGKFKILNYLVLNLDGKKNWIFHGDVFDITMQHSKWLAKLGGLGYDFLIMINTLVNWFSSKLGKGRISLSKRIKDNVKQAVKYIHNFEKTVAGIAISNGYHRVICGHIHQPQIRLIMDKEGQRVIYMNSGDWIENMTSLEYNQKKWSIYRFQDDALAQQIHQKSKKMDPSFIEADMKNGELFEKLVKEFQVMEKKGSKAVE